MFFLRVHFSFLNQVYFKKQGIEPIKISLRSGFRKIYFYRFKSAIGSPFYNNFGSGAVRVHQYQILEVRIRLWFKNNNNTKLILGRLICLFLLYVSTVSFLLHFFISCIYNRTLQ